MAVNIITFNCMKQTTKSSAQTKHFLDDVAQGKKNTSCLVLKHGLNTEEIKMEMTLG